MYEEIKELLQQNEYVKAKELLERQKQNIFVYDDTFAILEAELYRSQNDRLHMFECIKRGLEYNYANYELYFMLGEYYYLPINPYQAFLCFEQAEFYCDDENDRTYIAQMKKELSDASYSVPKITIVILSYNCKDEMALCLRSIRNSVPEASCEIVVIDNASTDGITDYLKEQKGIKLVCNDKNVGFPAGCNQGIKIAEPYNDILLLNNDTFVPPNAVFWLRMGLYESDSVGGTGSISNYCSNYQQVSERFETPSEYINYATKCNLPMEYPYEKKIRLVGFAYMIKRTVLDTVGLLDERFSPGSYEDDDLSYRIIRAGYQLLLCKNSFIYHYGSRSFGQEQEKYNLLGETNAAKLKEKWGFDLRYYSYERRELVNIIKKPQNEQMRILEIGCGMGATLGYLKNKYPLAEVYGIEIDEQVVCIAKKYIPTIEQGNIETMILNYPENYFDYIIFADVLEHLYNPQMVLHNIRKYLKNTGSILASIPNIMHYTVVLDLLKGNFTYSDSGILDKTHLRFFTINEITKLFQTAGFCIEEIRGSYFAKEMSAEERTMYDALIKIPGVANEQNFEVYQYLLEAKRLT